MKRSYLKKLIVSLFASSLGFATLSFAQGGRIEIINNPTKNISGQSYLFDANSNPNGICRSLGFDRYVENTLGYRLDDAGFVTVDAYGRVTGVAGDSIGEVVTSIGCAGRDHNPGPGPIVGRLIRFPTYDLDGVLYYFDSFSAPDSVCRFLGYRRAVPRTMDTRAQHDVNIISVGTSGRIERIEEDKLGAFIVSKIMCR